MMARPAPSALTVAAGLVLCLIVCLGAWHFVRFSTGAALIALVILVPPWLAVLPGILAGQRRVLQGSAFLVTPYLAYGLTEVLANPGARAFAGATVLVAFAVFVAVVHALKTGAAAR